MRIPKGKGQLQWIIFGGWWFIDKTVQLHAIGAVAHGFPLAWCTTGIETLSLKLRTLNLLQQTPPSHATMGHWVVHHTMVLWTFTKTYQSLIKGLNAENHKYIKPQRLVSPKKSIQFVRTTCQGANKSCTIKGCPRRAATWVVDSYLGPMVVGWLVD